MLIFQVFEGKSMQGSWKKVTWFLEKPCLVVEKRSFGFWEEFIGFSRGVFSVTTNSVLRYSEECLRL